MFGAPQAERRDPVVDLDWIYKKDELGLKPVERFLPQGFQWSPSGHWLYFEQPTPQHGVVGALVDPLSEDSWTVIRFSDLSDAVRAAQEAGASELIPDLQWSDVRRPAASVYPVDGEVDEDSDDSEGLPEFRWLEDENLLRFQFGGAGYELDPEDLSIRFAERSVSPDNVDGELLARSTSERYVAYVRDRDLYVTDLVDDRENRLTSAESSTIINGKFPWVYWEELMWRSSYQAYEWSPDESRIAFFQFDVAGVDRYPITDYATPNPKTEFQIYPKAGSKNPSVRLGVVSLSSRETRWVDLGAPSEYLIHITWKPDGSGFYVQSLNRDQNHLRLYEVDPELARGEILLEERSETWVSAYNMPIPLPDSSFLWLSDRSGFTALERVTNRGRTRDQITPLGWQVDRRGFGSRNVFVNTQRGEVVFSARRPTPLDRTVYSVPINGAKPVTRITGKQGTHRVDFSADGEAAVNTWTQRETPSQIDLIARDGSVIETLGKIMPEDYRPYRFGVPETITFKTDEGVQLYGSLLKPLDFDSEKKYPVIAYVYGEPAGQVVRDQFVDTWDQTLANEGFLVFRFDGRGSAGRGREWIESIYRDQLTVPMADWRMAVDELRSMPFVDGERMGVWGWSGGGTMTLNLMLREPGLFQAGASVAAVTDKRYYDTIYTERYLGRPQENPDGYRLSSPIHAADQLEGALLIAHGLSDDNVHPQNAFQLVDALNAANKAYEFYLFPQRGHGIGGQENRLALYSRILEFFKRELLSPRSE